MFKLAYSDSNLCRSSFALFSSLFFEVILNFRRGLSKYKHQLAAEFEIDPFESSLYVCDSGVEFFAWFLPSGLIGFILGKGISRCGPADRYHIMFKVQTDTNHHGRTRMLKNRGVHETFNTPGASPLPSVLRFWIGFHRINAVNQDFSFSGFAFCSLGYEFISNHSRSLTWHIH